MNDAPFSVGHSRQGGSPLKYYGYYYADEDGWQLFNLALPTDMMREDPVIGVLKEQGQIYKDPGVSSLLASPEVSS